jgi:hypothetical protein
MNTSSNTQAQAYNTPGYYLNRVLSAAAATVLTVIWMAAAQPAHTSERSAGPTAASLVDTAAQSAGVADRRNG